MPDSGNGLRDELIATDDEFRRLFEEHQNYERRLEEIHRKAFASQDDEFEMKQIKLHKLALKDRMEAILHSRREASVPA